MTRSSEPRSRGVIGLHHRGQKISQFTNQSKSRIDVLGKFNWLFPCWNCPVINDESSSRKFSRFLNQGVIFSLSGSSARVGPDRLNLQSIPNVSEKKRFASKFLGRRAKLGRTFLVSNGHTGQGILPPQYLSLCIPSYPS